jgi:hypothetical protein
VAACYMSLGPLQVLVVTRPNLACAGSTKPLAVMVFAQCLCATCMLQHTNLLKGRLVGYLTKPPDLHSLQGGGGGSRHQHQRAGKAGVFLSKGNAAPATREIWLLLL